jgi:betaine-aldehyde dehydrogenase
LRCDSAATSEEVDVTSRLRNYVNGALVDATSGRFSDGIDPCTGEA